MFRTLASLLGDWQRAVTVVLGVGAAAGWGMLAVSSQSAAETERQLQEWVATLQDSQKQLLLERDRSQVASVEVARLRDQLNSAQAEIARLAQGRTQAQLRTCGPAAGRWKFIPGTSVAERRITNRLHPELASNSAAGATPSGASSAYETRWYHCRSGWRQKTTGTGAGTGPEARRIGP